MLTETRLRKTGAVEPLPAAIGADAAVSVGEAELARRPNGVWLREARFGKTMARVEWKEELGSHWLGSVYRMISVSVL